MDVTVIGAAPGVAQQAGSDDEMVALWLGLYRSPHTRRGYAIDVAAFRTFADRPLTQVTVRDIQGFAATLGHLAPATAARRLSAVKSLIALAHRLGYLTYDVGAPIQLPAIQDRLAERIMSEWEMQRMLGLEKRPRNAALLRLLYSAGLRISEACGLRWRDLTERGGGGTGEQARERGVKVDGGAKVDPGSKVDSGQISVFGKGGKTRSILLPSPIWARLSTLRRDAGPDDPVFRSRQGGALNPSQVHRIVKAAAKRAKLSVLVSAHWMRHAHASHALDRGAPVHVVQATLGHASLATTTRYSHARPGDSSARYLNA
jgi:integrase/recombinase XerD